MILLKTWRDVLARKGQFLALGMLVMLGIMSYVAFISAYRDLKASTDNAITELHFSDFTTKVLQAPETVVRRVEMVDGVKAAEGRLVLDTGLELEDGAEATARVVGIPPAGDAEVNRIILTEGRLPREGERDAAVVNTKFAYEVGVGTGDTLTIKTDGRDREIRITGVGSSPEYLYPVRAKGEIPSPGEFAVLFAEQEQVQNWFSRVGAINDVAVMVAAGADLDDVIDDVEEVLDPYYVLDSVPRDDQPSNFGLQEEIEQNRVMASFMPFLVLVISSLSLFIALSRLVQSQRGEIGLMKALGYTDSQVLGHYLAFSLVIALIGSTAGIALGQWSAGGIAALYVSMLGIPGLTSHIYPDVMLTAVLMSSVACVAAGIVPAWAAVRLPPAKAMHSDPNLAVTGGRVPLVERLFGWALPRSFTFRIPLRNIFRSRRRSLYTVIGIAFSMVLTVATWSMFDAVDYIFVKVFEHTEQWDVLAAFEEPFSPGRVVDVSRWEGVREVEPAMMIPVEIKGPDGTYDIVITAMDPSARFHGFDITGGEEAETALAEGGLVMAQSVIGKLGVDVGDTVRVDSPYIEQDKALTVSAISDETLGGPVFASADVGRTLMGTGGFEYNVMYLFVDPERGDAIGEDLRDLPGATQVQVKATFLEKLEELMAFTLAFGGIMLAFGLAMSAAVIYNTFTANILERTREIATMRTIGESNARIAVMVTLENVFLALVAVPLGVWLGLRAADAMYASFSTEAYSFKAIIYPESVAWIIVISLVVLLLSEIPPVRRIFRLDLAEATKVME